MKREQISRNANKAAELQAQVHGGRGGGSEAGIAQQRLALLSSGLLECFLFIWLLNGHSACSSTLHTPAGKTQTFAAPSWFVTISRLQMHHLTVNPAMLPQAQSLALILMLLPALHSAADAAPDCEPSHAGGVQGSGTRSRCQADLQAAAAGRQHVRMGRAEGRGPSLWRWRAGFALLTGSRGSQLWWELGHACREPCGILAILQYIMIRSMRQLAY